MVPQSLILWNSRPLLLALRQDPEVARLASDYLKVITFAFPAYAYFECIRRWLQAQGISRSLEQAEED